MSKHQLQYLTADQVASYEKNGYLILDNFVTPEQISAMKQQASAWMDEFEKNTEIPVFLFTTHADQASQRNAYFQNSVHGIWPFFEEKAVDPSTRTLTYPYKQSINKIGHGTSKEASTALILLSFVLSSPVFSLNPLV